ncbi:MAG: hydroxymethylbilane synthase [Clostridia bacterium]|nr:hydroxymethylbilane synthase [Clostridia bacterium]
MSKTLRLATRGSRLALAQAGLVKEALEAKGATVELVTVSTRGDRDRTSPLSVIGGQGLFVREVEHCLLEGSADLAVHSGKDLPYELAEGLTIGGVPKAAAPHDVLVSRRGVSIRHIGSSSPRRVLECRRHYPQAVYSDLRGNVDTRLQKLRDGQYDGILLAKAGLERLQADLSDFDVREFTPEEFLPAPCQGVLAVECREEDTALRELLASVSDPLTRKRFDLERALFARLQADCSAAIGVYASFPTEEETELSVLFREQRMTRRGKDPDALIEEVLRELIV